MTRRCRAALAVPLVVVAVAAFQMVAVSPAAAGGDEVVRTYGYVTFEGSTQGLALNAGVVDIAGAGSDFGYWLLGYDGGVFSFGDAQFWGSMGGLPLNAPIIGIEPTPSGKGYWLFAGDGGVFSFGDAQFWGSTGDLVLNQPIVDMAATPDGDGYWLFASDGGVFSFGSAEFYGSTGGLQLDAPIVALEPTGDGGGYWLAAQDGEIFEFGNAPDLGDAKGIGNAAIVDIESNSTADGLWLAAADGAVLEFGTAPHLGDAAGTLRPDEAVVAMQNPIDYGYRLLVGSVPGVLPPLAPGDSGPAVAALQSQLTDLGYWLGEVDGGYGLVTSQAVTAFQKVNGLERTGRVDAATQEALAGATRPVPRSTSGYVIEVDKTRQVIIAARDGRAEWVINTSTGTEQSYVFEGRTYLADTPEGQFKINFQVDGVREGQLGTLIRPKYISHPDGIAFHGYSSVPPYPASHGCMRMSLAAIDWVWAADIMPLGTSVWIYR